MKTPGCRWGSTTTFEPPLAPLGAPLPPRPPPLAPRGPPLPPPPPRPRAATPPRAPPED